jgi:hypothetical protein
MVSPVLIGLPSELLHLILIQLEPSDISCLSQTCRHLYYSISTSDHLWRLLYDQRWDCPRENVLDPLLTQPCPKTKVPLSTKGKGKANAGQFQHLRHNTSGQNMEVKLLLDCISYDHNDSFESAKQVKRRAWAEKRVKRLTSRPIELVSEACKRPSSSLS